MKLVNGPLFAFSFAMSIDFYWNIKQRVNDRPIYLFVRLVLLRIRACEFYYQRSYIPVMSFGPTFSLTLGVPWKLEDSEHSEHSQGHKGTGDIVICW